MKTVSRTGIGMAVVLGIGVCAIAFGQMMPPGGGAPPAGGGYVPPAGGGGTGGGSTPTGPSYYSITASKSGNGSGTVTATGAMINCGASCSAQVMGGSIVTMAATPDVGSAFGGWSGSCSGTGSCSVSVASNVTVTAIFNTEPQGAGGGGSGGNDDGDEGDDGGGGYTYEEQYPTYASEFQDQFVAAKKPVKKRGVFKGYTPVIGQIKPMDKPFTGAVIGSNWKLAGSAAEQVAQGVTVGKGSRTTIRVNMTTGTVNAQFEGKDGCWMVSYYNDQGAERKELYKCKGDVYQEEFVPGGEGEGSRLALIAHQGTIYGEHDAGSFFMVAKGAAIDTPPAGWIEGSIPIAREPMIPVERILQLVAGVAQAAERQLSAVEIYRIIGVYRGVQAAMYGIQQSFGAIDFNSPDVDYGAVEVLVSKYQEAEGRLASIARQMGLASVFVRDGYWASAMGAATDGLVANGVHPTAAAFFAQAKQGFDFYTVTDMAGKTAVAGGTCTASTDAEGYPATTCSTKRIGVVEAARVAGVASAYRESKASANRAMNGVEKALFSGNGQ